MWLLFWVGTVGVTGDCWFWTRRGVRGYLYRLHRRPPTPVHACPVRVRAVAVDAARGGRVRGRARAPRHGLHEVADGGAYGLDPDPADVLDVQAHEGREHLEGGEETEGQAAGVGVGGG